MQLGALLNNWPTIEPRALWPDPGLGSSYNSLACRQAIWGKVTGETIYIGVVDGKGITKL